MEQNIGKEIDCFGKKVSKMCVRCEVFQREES